MILIFGGTTEGRIAIQTLEEAGKTFYYSTKGDEQDVLLHNGIRLQGAMDAIEIETFCAQHHIKLLIDAAHPFATQLHETLEQVSVESNIPVIRFERIFPERDEEHITWCRDYDDAIEKIQKEKIFILLALTGVQTIGKLKPLWQNACCYFRILDRNSSRKLAREQGFSEKNLYYYTPGEDEQVLMKQLHPEAILLTHDIYFVYLRAGKIFVHAIIMVVTETKKNISSFIFGKASFTAGSSPTVAPVIINNNRISANRRLPLLATGSVSLPLANITNTEDSPQVCTKESSAITTNVSPSRKYSFSKSCV